MSIKEDLMKEKNFLYIRKYQSKKIDRIRWICAMTMRRLDDEKPKSEIAEQRRIYEYRFFYKIWRLCRDMQIENEQILAQRGKNGK